MPTRPLLVVESVCPFPKTNENLNQQFSVAVNATPALVIVVIKLLVSIKTLFKLLFII